ncbi:MAG: MATE family efflux transporter [Lachnospiraceae bacterium]|nr:MATE family efflux transporter [Lachnospiraceae bacterium]
MKKTNTTDMTQGNPLRLIILFTIPLVLGNIFQQLYNIGDAKVVSYFIDENALAAVGLTAVVSNMLIGLINGFTQGFGIMTANAFGARDEDRIRRYIAGATVLTVILVALLSVLAFIYIRPVLELLNTPDELMDDALSYVKIILMGISFSAIYNLSANLLRSLGDSRTPLYCLMASIALNIILDIFFVGSLKWGIKGAAVATVISQAVAGLVCMGYGAVHFKRYLPGREDFHVRRDEINDLFLTGLSMGLMGCIVNIGTIVLQGSINKLGADVVSAHTAGRRLVDILMSLIYTYGFTMTTYVSQNAGAGRTDRIKQGVKIASLIVTVESVVIIAFTWLFARGIVTWIASTDNTMICDDATMYCRVMTLFFPVLGPLFILRCTLQGVGRKMVPLVSSGMELTIKVLSAMWLVPWLGYFGVALTEPISWTVMTLTLFIGYLLWARKEA